MWVYIITLISDVNSDVTLELDLKFWWKFTSYLRIGPRKEHPKWKKSKSYSSNHSIETKCYLKSQNFYLMWWYLILLKIIQFFVKCNNNIFFCCARCSLSSINTTDCAHMFDLIQICFLYNFSQELWQWPQMAKWYKWQRIVWPVTRQYSSIHQEH
jgi:hypothetical protein